MDDFSSPNITNMFKLPPTPYNHVRPGKRPMSSMTPMILTDSEGNAQLVIGGNGGTTITSGVMQVGTYLKNRSTISYFTLYFILRNVYSNSTIKFYLF